MSARQWKNEGITMSAGNKKLDKSIGIFNLPAGKDYTCENTCKNCYAIKAQYLYPQVLPCRIRNFEASKQENFVSLMVALIVKAKFKVVRIHESGDFYSIEYMQKWDNIAKQLPEIKFYAYTKRNFVEFTANNVNIVNSLLPDGNINYGDLDYVKVMAKLHNVPVCPVTLNVKNAKCGLTCVLCQTVTRMLFVIH
jgi:hypothetical protein